MSTTESDEIIIHFFEKGVCALKAVKNIEHPEGIEKKKKNNNGCVG